MFKVLIFLIAFPALCFSAEVQNTSVTIDGLTGGSSLSITTHVIDGGSTLDPLNVEFIFSADNPENKELTVTSASIVPVGVIENLYNKEDYINKQCNRNRPFVVGKRKNTFSLLCYFEPKFSLINIYRAMFITPGSSPYLLTLKLAGESESIEKIIMMPQKIAQSSIVLAGAIGAFLYAVLHLLSGLSIKKSSKFLTSDLIYKIFNSILSLIRQTSIGAVVSAIILALTKTSTSLGAPISINVESIWGGLLVGLGSLVFAKSILNKFSDSKQE